MNGASSARQANADASLSAHPPSALQARIALAIADTDGWLPFDRFMSMALYEPGLGYYACSSRQFGSLPSSGSDFVTAPELSPLFGRALARQVRQVLDAAGADRVVEFGAGSGALAEHVLQSLGDRVARYEIVDLSGALRARQAERLAPFGSRVQWLCEWPEVIDGVVLGNEVLDAMPVQLLHFDGSHWLERGVALRGGQMVFADRPTALRPPGDSIHLPPAFVTEIHPQAEAFVRTLADKLRCGAAFFIDYGFPESEYYLPDRNGGTLMCHRGHRADTDPLIAVGAKDITAHVNFSGIALAGQDAGLDVLGYTSQARFLMNCGLLDELRGHDAHSDCRAIAAAQRLLNEHEMGELFKVIGFARGIAIDPLGFTTGDRSHTL
ncbi:MAG: SAM-dependent methyltransferase [Rubrivivax sp.]